MQVSVEHSRSDDGLLKRHRNYKKSVCMYYVQTLTIVGVKYKLYVTYFHTSLYEL